MFDLSINETNSSSTDPSEFRGKQGRILCLDVGDKRIGMAISDPLGITAQGLPTLIRQGLKHDIGAIVGIIGEYEITRVVYGLPINMNGSLGPQVEKTESFIRKLSARTDCPFVPWDERLTSMHAQSALREAGMSRKKRAERVDRLSAVLILQNYLDLNQRSRQNR